jgi:23S rRNA (uracil1939-C5)-methyltransferase
MLQDVRLRITSLDDEGRGVATDAGREIHVAGALPDEDVTCALEHESPHAPRAWARLVSVDKPANERVPPSCPGHGRCGGCVLQHLAYPAQLTYKRQLVERALGEGVPVEDVVASPRELHYRNKAKYVVAPGGRIGSYAPGTHDFVDMAGCQVPEPPIDEVARLAAKLAAALPVYDESKKTGELRHLIVRANADGLLLVVYVARSLEAKPALAVAARELRTRRPDVAGVVLNLNDAPGNVILGDRDLVLDGADALEDTVGDVRLQLSARAFFQINRAQAARLYAEAARHARPGDRAVDLYTGVGGIALALAKKGAHVLGVETHAQAVADARRSARANGVSARFEVGDAASAHLEGADLLVVDPPRKGLGEATRAAIARAQPRTIVYVSCYPKTLADDVKALGELGWRVESVRPFDLMPGTPHIEVVTTLRRAGGSARRSAPGSPAADRPRPPSTRRRG